MSEKDYAKLIQEYQRSTYIMNEILNYTEKMHDSYYDQIAVNEGIDKLIII